MNKNLRKIWESGCLTGRGFNGKEYIFNGKPAFWKIAKSKDYIFLVPTDKIGVVTVYKVNPKSYNSESSRWEEVREEYPYNWECEQLKNQQQDLNVLLNSGWLTGRDSKGNTQTYNRVNINKDRAKAIQILGGDDRVNNITGGKDYYMWIPKEAPKEKGFVEKGQQIDINKEAEKLVNYLVTNQNWVREVPMGEVNKYIKCDLGNTGNKDTQMGKNCYVYPSLKNYGDYARYFKGGYTLYMPISTEVSTSETPTGGKNYSDDYKFACSTAKKNNFDKKSCFTCILNYYNATKNSAPNSSPDPGYPELVDQCLKMNSDKFPRLKNPIKYLRGDGLGSRKSNWGINIASYKNKRGLFGQIKEERMLKKTINESLMNLKLKKQKLLTENTIIKSRIEILVEGKNLRKKSDLNNFFNELLIETAYLNQQGYNQEIINENIMSMLGTFFAGKGLDSVLQYFKEYAAKWVIQKFGLDPNSWLATIVITTIGNIPVGDITKLTDCDYVVPLLSKSIAESFVKKFLIQKGMDNAFTSVVRNAVVEIADDLVFIQAIEKGLAKVVCPLLQDLTGKMGTVTNKLVKKQQGSSQQGSSQQGIGNQLGGLLGGLLGGK